MVTNDDTSPRQLVPPAVESGHYQQYHDDEIDLIDIWRLLVRRWQWIAVITLTCTALAVAYFLLAPRVYRVEASILPPRLSDVEQLNNPQFNDVSEKDVYGEALNNLRSVSVRQLFFDEHALLESLRGQVGENAGAQKVFARAFHQRLTVAQGKKERSDFVMVSLEGGDPELITTLLNNFLAMVNGYSVDLFLKDLYTNLGSKKEAIESNIEVLRQVARDRRLDRIAELQEALYVATHLGIERRADVLPSSSSQAGSTPGYGIIVNTVDTPLYLRGVRELQAEIDILKKRQSDDPFIPSLRAMQEELSRLNQIQVNPDKVKAFRLDQPAVVPGGPVKPKRNLVVALGAILGLMLGVFVAFVVNFIETARRQERPE